MSNNGTNICLTNQQMRLHGNEVEKYLQRFVYPCIAILGITGNVLNLTVLLNRSMRSRKNRVIFRTSSFESGGNLRLRYVSQAPSPGSIEPLFSVTRYNHESPINGSNNPIGFNLIAVLVQKSELWCMY
uniref:G-protein coupled receptors family 1 profile domain-containing protein n=1 Tax=Setaria digitata TaxID=48799 RepID=A0A915PVL0_9BILA